MKLAKLPTLMIMFGLLSLNVHSFSIYPGFKLYRFVGHEEITRQSLLMTNEIIKNSEYDLKSDVVRALSSKTEKKYFGSESGANPNIISLGNRAADKPDGSYPVEIDIRNTSGFPTVEEIPNQLKWGGARAFHFTRNEYFGEVEKDRQARQVTFAGNNDPYPYYYDSAKEVCEEAQSHIFEFTKLGLDWLQKASATGVSQDDREQRIQNAFFSFGVATHIIQDSFSPSHTYRRLDEDLNYRIQDICYYDQHIHHILPNAGDVSRGIVTQNWGQSDDVILDSNERLEQFEKRAEIGPCAHSKADMDDFVWMRTPKQSQLLEEQFSRESLWEQKETELFQDFVNPTFIEKRLKRLTKEKMRLAGEALLKDCQGERIKSTDRDAFNCLKLEAKLARMATTQYFLFLLNYFHSEKPSDADEQESHLQNELQAKFFEGAIDDEKIPNKYRVKDFMRNGVINCGNLESHLYLKATRDFEGFTQIEM